MKNTIEAACRSEIGKIRMNNEDNFFFDGSILPENNNGTSVTLSKRFSDVSQACFGIFDGMGGEADGQVASHLAANAFLRDYQQNVAGGLLSESFFDRAVLHMNNQVSMAAARNHTRMGTTAVLMGFCDDTVYISNVGDSKAFRFRAGKLTQISVDHVESAPPYLTGRQSKPRLTQYIGIPSTDIRIEPYIARSVFQAEDTYLLCSDGLTDMVSSAEIQLILSENSNATNCVERLLEQTMKNGGRDNTTVIVARILAEVEEANDHGR